MQRFRDCGASFAYRFDNIADIQKKFTISGTPILSSDSPYGKAMTFDGSTDYLTTTVNKHEWDITSTTFSIVFRFNPTALNFVLCGNGRQDNYGWHLFINGSGQAQLETSQSSAHQDTATVTGSIVVGEDTTLVYTQSSGVGNFYKNGTLLSKATDNTHLAATSNGTLTIGAYYNASTKFNGKLYEVLIFPRALSTQEISDISTNSVFDYTKNLISMWSF